MLPWLVRPASVQWQKPMPHRCLAHNARTAAEAVRSGLEFENTIDACLAGTNSACAVAETDV
jgi:hypothetical protein